MRHLLNDLFYWLSPYKWRCLEKDCGFKTHAGDNYIVEMVKDAHRRHHNRLNSSMKYQAAHERIPTLRNRRP